MRIHVDSGKASTALCIVLLPWRFCGGLTSLWLISNANLVQGELQDPDTVEVEEERESV